jgi:hypothetical protein
MKKVLESLLSLDKSQFDSVVKTINPSVTSEDLKPMFSEGWSNDGRWPEFNYNYDSFAIHQLAIDRANEEMFS